MNDIRQRILLDEADVAAKAIDNAKTAVTRAHWTNRDGHCRTFRNAAVFDDGSDAAAVALAALRRCKAFGRGAAVLRCGPGADGGNAADGAGGHLPRNCAALVFADCRRAPANPERWLSEASAFFTSAAKDRHSFVAVCALLPEIDPLPAPVTAVAEKEYSALIEAKPERTGAEKFLLAVEALCREAVSNMGANVILLRMPHVFGPSIKEEGFSVRGIAEAAVAAGRVEIGEEDFGCVRSFTTAVDAVAAAWHALLNATPGNIFNISSFDASAADIKRIIHSGFPERLSISAECPAGAKPEYRRLSTIKFAQTRFKVCFSIEASVRRLVCHVGSMPYPPTENDAIYQGHLDKIKALELGILKEVDRICEKHGIKFFLAAGTLLGAKRYGHNIPWDDDLDIGMLRPDFEKFRKVAEKELPPHLIYCNYFNGTENPYLVDKIRYRDTWFSTRYSSVSPNPDGVFLDILVYDATSDIRPIAWFHNKLLGVFQYFLYFVIWRKPKKREFRSPLTYLPYRVLALVPFRTWHWLYETWLKMFSFKRHPRWLVDGLGARAGIGFIPAAGLMDTVRIPFDGGMMAPSPVDPSAYLEWAYGKDWKKEPPLSEQHGHALARIDLGANILERCPESDPGFSIFGELRERNSVGAFSKNAKGETK